MKDIIAVNHLHTMRVGTKNLLFIAEVNVVAEANSPIEIEASDPANWGLKVLFQMISSGSSRLCHGQSDDKSIKNVSAKSLSSVTKYSL